MYKIKTLNTISPYGLDALDTRKYKLDNENENPDAIILRSYNMHGLEMPKNVKAIARAGAGVNNIPVESYTEKGIVVFNTPGANANAVKELVLTSIIATSRNLFDGVLWTKTLKDQENIPTLVESGKKKFVGSEIKGKTLGVIGLGAIGALVANSALDLDMDVIGFDPFISVDTAWNLSRNVKRAFSIEQLYSASDYITVHVPYTDDTKEMFNKSVFEILKPGVHLFNFSRGELVNEIDLEVAIEKGTVRTYVTDFPNEHVLKMENTVSIPHLGASTIESEENCALMAVKQVREFLETGNIKNSINFPNANLPYTGKFRVTVFHLNVPNMVSKITNILSTYSLNIADMMNRSKGNFAYTMIDIDSDIENAKKSELDEQLNKIDGIIKVRFI